MFSDEILRIWVNQFIAELDLYILTLHNGRFSLLRNLLDTFFTLLSLFFIKKFYLLLLLFAEYSVKVLKIKHQL